jgi:hypothetical protein
MALNYSKLFRHVALKDATEFRCAFCDRILGALATNEHGGIPVCECQAATRYVAENLDGPVLFDVNNPEP